MLDLKADGTITVQFPPSASGTAGTLYLLRVPVLDEVYDLWRALEAATPDGATSTTSPPVALAAPQTAASNDDDDGGDADVLAAAASPEAAARTIERQIAVLQANARWFAKALHMLATPAFPVDGQVPAWAGNGTVAARCLNHWQAVPLVPGAA